MAELVSGWTERDGKTVCLVFRDGERVSYRKVAARWSCFVRGLDDADRARLQRMSDVTSLVPSGDVTRIDFRNRWARIEIARKLSLAIDGARLMDALSGSEEDEGGLGPALLEADVQPLRRLLSDVGGLQIGMPRIGYLDLETDSRKTFQDMLEGKARILSWALTDATRTRRASMVLEADTDDAERALLSALFIAAEQFDCLLAWNGADFDFPVLDQRQQRLKVRHRDRPVIWERWTWLDQMMCFRKYNQAHESGEERASFALDAVAKHLLGEGKVDFNARYTWEAWAAGGEERAKLLRYNEHDTDLLPRIEEKTGFVALHMAVCQVTRCFPDTESLGAAQQGDGFMLRLGAELGFRFPTKKQFDDQTPHQQFLGAYVMEPRRIGALDNVHVCDFAGLYPSIMRSWNMSPDTYLSPMEARSARLPFNRLPDRATYFRTDKRGLFPHALDRLVAQRGEYTKLADAAEPGSHDWHHYKRLSSAFKIVVNSFYGIVGSPFTRFFDRTIAEGVTQTGAWLIKHSMRVAEQSKLEPFYGDTDSVFVMGEQGEPHAVSEAKFARVVETLNESWPKLLADHGCTESRIKLEFEKSFRRLVLVSKKRYAGAFSRYKGKPAPADMKPEIKGLEFKRGDTLRLAREMQAQAIDLLLGAEVPTMQAMRDFVTTWRERVLRGELAIDDILLSQSVKNLDEYRDRFTSARCTGKIGVKKAAKSCGYDFGSTDVPKPEITPGAKRRAKKAADEGEAPPPEVELPRCPKCGAARKLASQPAHVRVAKVMAARGELIRSGTRIEYLVVGTPEDSDDDKLQAMPARDEGVLERIDREYYWDKRVLPPTSRLLEAVYPSGSWDESAAKRRRAAAAEEKAAKKTKNKGKVVDLPLFGAVSDRSDTQAPAQAVAGSDVVPVVQDGAAPPEGAEGQESRRRRPAPRMTW